MSASIELQVAVLGALVASTRVHAICADRIYDGRPKDGSFPCVTFGPSDYVPDDFDGIAGRVEALQLDCWVRDKSGRLHPVKALVDAVKDALHESDLSLNTHALARLRVTMTRSFMDPDGETAHGIVMLEAQIEEV